MKRLPLAAITATLCLSFAQYAPAVYAASLATEDFEGTPAPAALNGTNGGTGFTTAWTAVSTATFATKSLSPPGGPSGSLQAALLSGSNDSIMQRSFAPFSSGPLYVGFTVRADNLEAVDFLNVQVSNGGTGNSDQALGVGIRNVAGNPFFARSGDSGDTTTTASTNAMSMTDYRVVAKFSQNALQYEIAELFINPTSDTEPVLADALASNAAPNITQLSLLTVRTVGIGNANEAIFLDDIVIADDFATAAALAAVPEPSSIALWTLLGLIGVGFGWRRTRCGTRI